MKRVARGLLAAVLLAFAGSVWAQAPPDPVDIADSLMSPVCPGRLISNCPSPEAEQLREVIRRQVAEGKTKQQVIDYFVEVYGSSVLPAPPQKGWFLTAWYLPLALMLSGGGIIFLLLRIWSRGGEEKAPPPAATTRVPEDPEHSRYARILDEELREYDR